MLKLRIKVKNEDVAADRGGPGHEIRLATNAGNCPAGVVTVAPDFLPRTPGSQDAIVVRPGKKKTATIVLTVAASDFFSPDAATPARCQMTVVAVGPGADPTPANNTTAVMLEVDDDNDR